VPRSAPLFWVSARLFGALLGLSYLWTGRFGLAIGLHLGINACLANLFGFELLGVGRSNAANVIQSMRVVAPDLWTSLAVSTTLP
jgi:hypothetical protein